jgi:hypothetical protein
VLTTMEQVWKDGGGVAEIPAARVRSWLPRAFDGSVH